MLTFVELPWTAFLYRQTVKCLCNAWDSDPCYCTCLPLSSVTRAPVIQISPEGLQRKDSAGNGHQWDALASSPPVCSFLKTESGLPSTHRFIGGDTMLRKCEPTPQPQMWAASVCPSHQTLPRVPWSRDPVWGSPKLGLPVFLCKIFGVVWSVKYISSG